MTAVRLRASSARSAFTIPDVLALIACIAIVLCAAATGLARSRSASNLALCSARLGGIGAGSANFALSHNGDFAALNWEVGGNNSLYPDLNAYQAVGALEAHVAQVVDLLRRRGLAVPALVNWIPDVQYSALVLTDFENRPLSDLYNVCPMDELQLKWRRSPESFAMGRFLPRQPSPDAHNTAKFPNRSSYSWSGAAIDRNQTVFTAQAQSTRIAYAGQYNTYMAAPTPNLGPSALSTVAFPSHKTYVFDTVDRHFGPRPVHFDSPQARGPILFFDGSVSVRAAAEANTPWQPREPQLPGPQTYLYSPSPWEPAPASGTVTEQLTDHYRWTRDGLLGRDFN